MFDIVIIGAGISGMTAALYALRAGKSVLILESSSFGGQIINSKEIENYPGVKNIDGFSLMKNLYDQINSYGVNYMNEKVIKLIDSNTIVTENNTYKAGVIIIATGLKNKTLGLENESKYVGAGISYCATCDGNFFKGKDVAVVGGGNTALEDVIYLSNIVNKVYLIHRRDIFRADSILVDKVKSLNNVEIIYNANIMELIGDSLLSSIRLDNDKTLDVNGLFVAIGKEPDNYNFSNIVELDKYGFIISDDTTTSISNVFVAGDCRTKELRQLITAASDGAIAANKAINYLNNI